MIGFLDSGVGGLPILEAVWRACPAVPCFYYGDNQHFPYGNKTPDQIIQLALTGVQYLVAQGVNTVVLACNTVCSVAVDQLQQAFPQIQFVNVLLLTAQHVCALSFDRVVLLATQATVQAGQYPRILHSLRPDIHLKNIACTELIAAIERNEKEKAHWEYLFTKVAKQIDANDQLIVLGCTHFKHIVTELSRVFFDKELVSSESVVVEDLKLLLDSYRAKETIVKPALHFTGPAVADDFNKAIVL